MSGSAGDRRSRLSDGALESLDLTRPARDTHRHVMPAKLIAEAPRGGLGVDRIPSQDLPNRVRPKLFGAAKHSFPLGAELLDEHPGDPVDVGEHEDRTLVLAGGKLPRVIDANLHGLRPSLVEPGVAETVGAQEHRQGNAAANIAPQEVHGLVCERDVVDRRAVTEHPQHLADVGLAARK
jgi:hypothetical protein